MLLKNIQNFKIPEYVIIGSGPASISLALALEKKNKKSLIIEAGGWDYDEKDQHNFSGEVIGHNYFPLNTTHMRYFGGTSNAWGGYCRPLDEIDFKDWPIYKSDLIEFEDEAKNILNIKNKFENKNILNSNFNISNLEQSDVNFSTKFKDIILNSSNIFLLLNTTLTEINGKKNVETIKIKSNNEIHELKILNLIVGCGGIENSRILLWSRFKSKSNFLQNLKIGNYWMEHPTGYVGHFIGDINKVEKLKYFGSNSHITPSNNFLKKNMINNLNFSFFKTPPHQNKYFRILDDFACLAPNFSKKFIESLPIDSRLHCNYSILATVEQKPNFNNRIELSSSIKDDFGIPKTKLYWNINNDFTNSIRVSLTELGKNFIDSDIGRIGIDNYVFKNKVPDDIYGNYHHMGGTRISLDSSNGVVDKNLKVHNTNNLYVIGSSVFPSAGWVNPTFTIVQLSLRLSKYLTQNKV